MRSFKIKKKLKTVDNKRDTRNHKGNNHDHLDFLFGKVLAASHTNEKSQKKNRKQYGNLKEHNGGKKSQVYVGNYTEYMFDKEYHADICLKSMRVIGNSAEISTEKRAYAVYSANNTREQAYNEKNDLIALHFGGAKFSDKHFHANQNNDKAEYCFY